MFYHISKIDLGEQVYLIPRIPESSLGIIEGYTPRVCFAPSIWQCALGIAGSDSFGSILFELMDTTINRQNPVVYQTTKKLFKPNQKLSDFSKTNEHWSLDKIKVKKVGYIDMHYLLNERKLQITQNIKHNFTKKEMKAIKMLAVFGNSSWTKQHQI